MKALSIAATVFALGAATVVSGCSGAQADQTSKAGGSTPPVTLTIGTNDTPDRLSASIIEEFARQVAQRSDGGLVIEPVWRVGDGQADWDQQVARKVVSGELDLGMIPARAWDTEGVSTFQALHAPFLVDSDELMDAVVADPIAQEMLVGLEDEGVTGLALVPESLRRPFSFGEPVLAPADLAGQGIRVPTSNVGNATMEAVGARPTDAVGEGEQFPDSIADGSIVAAESSYDGAQNLPQRSVGTANVTLFPKVESLVANSEVLAGLTGTQREVLGEAAVGTRDWAIDEMPTDAKAAADFCARGYQTVLAPQRALEAWLDETRSVYVELERDPVTRGMIEAIRELETSVTVADPPVACGVKMETPPTTTATGDNVIPNGTYRRDNSLEDLVASGLDETTADEYAGVLTFTLEDGVYTETPPPGATFSACVGSYTSTETDLEVLFEVNCSGSMTATWSASNGELLLSDVVDPLNPDLGRLVEAVFGGRPFTKIS